MRRIALLVALVLATPAVGQVAATHPANPTSLDFIVVDVDKPDLDLRPRPVSIVGNEIRITISGVANTPAFGRDAVPVGRLAAGNYVIIVTFIYEDALGNAVLVGTQPPVPLTVAAGTAIPTMNATARLLLALAVAFGGTVALKA